MPNILAVSGSLRAKSFNTQLLRAAARAAPPDTTLEIASIRDIPVYDADLDAASGPPSPVRELKEKIAAADALLIATPEYNNSLPGVLKNAIDWVSRPSSDIPRVFGGCPVGVVGATTGAGGTILAQAAWLPVWRALGMLPFFGGRLIVSHAANAFDDRGALQDAALQAQLDKYMTAFAGFSSRYRRVKA
jgi:NAD(P)H-dependent FMN reductase